MSRPYVISLQAHGHHPMDGRTQFVYCADYEEAIQWAAGYHHATGLWSAVSHYPAREVSSLVLWQSGKVVEVVPGFYGVQRGPFEHPGYYQRDASGRFVWHAALMLDK